MTVTAEIEISGDKVKAVAATAASQVRGVERLDDRSRLILRLRFKDLTRAEIAAFVGCSPRQVSHVIERSVSMLLEDTPADSAAQACLP